MSCSVLTCHSTDLVWGGLGALAVASTCYDPRSVKSLAPHDTKTDVQVTLNSPEWMLCFVRLWKILSITEKNTQSGQRTSFPKISQLQDPANPPLTSYPQKLFFFLLKYSEMLWNFLFSPQALGLETSESKRNSFSSDSSKAKVQTQFLWGSKQKSGTYSHPILNPARVGNMPVFFKNVNRLHANHGLP